MEPSHSTVSRARLLLRHLAVGVLACVQPTTAQGEPPRRLALLVGIDRYDHVAPPPQGWPRLHAVADARTLAGLLQSPRWGFRPEDVLVLADEQATRRGIIDNFREHLVAQARPGDAALFYFAGHGQNLLGRRAGEPDRLAQSLVPWDYRSQSATDGALCNLRVDALGQMVAELQARVNAQGRNGNVTVVLDSCCSGSGLRGLGGEFINRGRDWDPVLDGPRPALTQEPGRPLACGLLGAVPPRGYAALAACGLLQSAKEFHAPTAGAATDPLRGALSWFLARELSRATSALTYRELLSRIVCDLKAAAIPEQDPELEGDLDSPLFGSGAQPLPAFHTVWRVLGGGRLGLPVGELHGATAGSVYTLYRAGGLQRPEARLAEATVVRVAVADCDLELAPADAQRLAPGDLAEAEAVETRHQPIADPLRVMADAVWAARLSDVRDIAITPGDAAPCDAALVAAAGRVSLQTRALGGLGAAYGELASWPDTAESSEPVGAALASLARWRHVSRLGQELRPDGGGIELRLVRGEAVTRDGVSHWQRDLPSPGRPGAPLVLVDGDCVTVEVRNPSPEPVYATLLDINPDGEIGLLLPTEQYPLPWQIPAHSGWVRPVVRGALAHWRLSALAGFEQFKAIFTREPVDLRGVAQPPIIDGSRTRSSPPPDPPLGWSTADVFFAVAR